MLLRNSREMEKKALEKSNSLHRWPLLGNVEGVRLPGLLKDRWRALGTEHLLLI